MLTVNLVQRRTDGKSVRFFVYSKVILLEGGQNYEEKNYRNVDSSYGYGSPGRMRRQRSTEGKHFRRK